ncbi:MAG: TetR family transcriptional regulator [Hyphomicrobiales bacterium]|nr:MAG: TetR family transcriptional regulator [Hyphomicrobiales bacterium]
MLDRKTSSKTEILDAAANCFMELGSDVASIDDIARTLGATKGRIYHHFSSKGALLSAVRMRAIMFILDEVTPIVNNSEAPINTLHDMAYTHVLKILETLPYHRVVLQHYRKNAAKSTTDYERKLISEIEAKRQLYENLYRDILEQGMKTGDFIKRDISVALHSVLLMLNSPVFWFTPLKKNERKNREEIAKQLADMAVACLR